MKGGGVMVMFWGMGKTFCGFQVSFFTNWKVASKKLSHICLFHTTLLHPENKNNDQKR